MIKLQLLIGILLFGSLEVSAQQNKCWQLLMPRPSNVVSWTETTEALERDMAARMSLTSPSDIKTLAADMIHQLLAEASLNLETIDKVLYLQAKVNDFSRDHFDLRFEEQIGDWQAPNPSVKQKVKSIEYHFARMDSAHFNEIILPAFDISKKNLDGTPMIPIFSEMLPNPLSLNRYIKALDLAAEGYQRHNLSQAPLAFASKQDAINHAFKNWDQLSPHSQLTMMFTDKKVNYREEIPWEQIPPSAHEEINQRMVGEKNQVDQQMLAATLVQAKVGESPMPGQIAVQPLSLVISKTSMHPSLSKRERDIFVLELVRAARNLVPRELQEKMDIPVYAFTRSPALNKVWSQLGFTHVGKKTQDGIEYDVLQVSLSDLIEPNFSFFKTSDPTDQ